MNNPHEELTDQELEVCNRCGEELNPETMVVLAYDRPNDKFYKSDSFNEGFPFGQACAKSVLRNKGKLKRIKGYTGW